VTVEGHISFCGLHLRTPRKGLEAVLKSWWGGLADLQKVTIERQREGDAVGKWLNQCRGPMIVAGDLNLVADSAIYRRAFGGLSNGFASAGWGWGATKFTRFHGVRIDHILANGNWRFTRCRVGPDVGSDHRPLIADIELNSPSASSGIGGGQAMRAIVARQARSYR
jgi:vancomycin resistance protein VanJ